MEIEVISILQEKIKQAVQDLYEIDLEKVFFEHPVNEKWGDYATNIAMEISKQVKQPSFDIAKNLHYKICEKDIVYPYKDNKIKIFEKIEVVSPGFINFKLSVEWLKLVLFSVITASNTYGSSQKGGKSKVLVEFSQPNPNKPMHIGHARNNFLGSSLANIFEFLGYDVVRINYMNDWGTHICKSMLMYQKYGEGKLPDKKPDHFVGDFYIMYEKESESNKELETELAEMFRKMEAGDPQTLKLWETITGWVYEGWQSTYADENVRFDAWRFQHDYKESGKEVVKIAMDKGIAEKDPSGAVIARLEKYGMPDKVLLRSDGTSIYSTQDLQLAKDDYDRYHFDRRLYVVDFRQEEYFRQVFKIMEILGFEWVDRLHHVSYGVVALPEGQMSSRKGLVVNADDVYEQLLNLETEEVKSNRKSDDEDSLNIIAKRVALAAFRYGMLKVDPKQDISFDYDYVTKFEGNTGPYLMYTYARTSSILEKSGKMIEINDPLINPVIYDEKEELVLRSLYRFPEEIEKAGEKYAPNVICNYLFDLAQRFNAVYAALPILNAGNPDVIEFRLYLTAAVRQVLKNGLNLIGIEVVEKM